LLAGRDADISFFERDDMISWIVGGLCYAVSGVSAVVVFGSSFAIYDGDQQKHTVWVALGALVVGLAAYCAGTYFLPFNSLPLQ
jgi:hypothetical protein